MNLKLALKAGELDPTNGAGTIKTKGGFRARRGSRKTKVKITRIVLGAAGGLGKLDAKVGKRKVKRFGDLSGGTLTRDGWGARLEGVSARLGSKGAAALNRVLTPGKPRQASTAAGGIKAGKRLGTVSVRSVPKTVEVLPGGRLVFESELGFGLKLLTHCIDGLRPGGVESIPPAVQSGLLGEIFSFPVTGGSIAPDFSAGRVISAGGQTLTKNLKVDLSPLVRFDCSGPPPLGTTVLQTEFEAQFDIQALAASVVLPTGPVGVGALGPFDLAAAKTSADPNTREVKVSDAPVTMDLISALTFNAVFPNATPNRNNDFKEGELLGHMSLNVNTH